MLLVEKEAVHLCEIVNNKMVLYAMKSVAASPKAVASTLSFWFFSFRLPWLGL